MEWMTSRLWVKIMSEEQFQKYYKNIKKEEIIKELFYKCKANYEVITELTNKIDKAIEYIENEIPCLWEIDKEWEDQEDNYHHTYKEYSIDILLDILKGVDKDELRQTNKRTANRNT